MKLWAVARNYDYEGMDMPCLIASTKEKAEAFVKHRKETSPFHVEYDIEEYEIDIIEKGRA